jgi:fructose-1,6-bisphosphatase/inositol monophosphatase family enzyme
MEDVIDDALAAAVGRAIREAVGEEVLPRRRRLAAHEVTQKTGPHDLVTVADRRAEDHLTRSLTALLPGSVVVGEESVHVEPSRYTALRGDAPVWIVDPVDGTRQFVRGDDGFCTLVALARHGEVLASWTYVPVPDLMAVARLHGGALLNGETLHAGSPAADRPLRVVVSHPDLGSATQRQALAGLRAAGVQQRKGGSAGLDYLRVAGGELDALVFGWELAWDHAAGLLLVAEAGGASATLTGASFSLSGGNVLPFCAARDAGTLRRILALLQREAM